MEQVAKLEAALPPPTKAKAKAKTKAAVVAQAGSKAGPPQAGVQAVPTWAGQGHQELKAPKRELSDPV